MHILSMIIEYGTENQVVYNQSKKQISVCAQLRSNILQLTAETVNLLAEEKWICPMSCLNKNG